MTRLRVLVFFFCGGGRVLGTSVLRYARPGARVGTILRGHAARGPFQRPPPLPCCTLGPARELQDCSLIHGTARSVGCV